MQMISRDDARALGLKTFFTGIPCMRLHVSPRYVLSGYCVECKRTRRARGWAEIGTWEFDEKIAKYERERRAKKGSNKGASKRQYAMGRARRQVIRARTPSWLTSEERQKLREFCRNKPAGDVTEHIVPLLPTRGEIVGNHTLQNLRYLTGRKNRSKANRLEGDPAEHVRAGRAIWRCHIRSDGWVDWQHYVAERLAAIWAALAKEFGTEPFTLADLAKRGMKTIPVRGPKTTTNWLNGNVGLLSGGYRLVHAAGLDGSLAWRLVTE